MKKNIAHGLAWESGTKIVVQVVSWVSTVLVARMVGPTDFGLFATAGLFTVVLQMLSDYGLASAVVTRPQISREEVRSAFWFNLYLSVTLYFGLYFLAPFIGSLYSLPVLAEIIRLSGLSLIISALRVVPYAMTMRELNFRFRALAETGGQLLQAAVVLLLAYSGYGVWSLIVAFVTGQLLTTILFLLKWSRVGLPSFNFRPIKDVLRLGGSLTVSRILAHITSVMDIAIVSATIGARAVGLFSMASQLANLPIDKIASIASRVAFPAFARLQDSQAQASRLFLIGHFFLLSVTAPAICGTALVANDLVVAVFSPSWHEMGVVLSCLCIAAVWKVSGVLMNSVIESFRRADLQLFVTVLTGVVAIPSFFIGARYGILGVAFAWLLITPVAWLMQCRFALRILDLPLRVFLLSLLPVGFGIGAMIIAVLTVKYVLGGVEHVSFRLVAQIAAGAVVYVVVLGLSTSSEYRAHFFDLIASVRSSSLPQSII